MPEPKSSRIAKDLNQHLGFQYSMARRWVEKAAKTLKRIYSPVPISNVVKNRGKERTSENRDGELLPDHRTKNILHLQESGPR